MLNIDKKHGGNESVTERDGMTSLMAMAFLHWLYLVSPTVPQIQMKGLVAGQVMGEL